MRLSQRTPSGDPEPRSRLLARGCGGRERVFQTGHRRAGFPRDPAGNLAHAAYQDQTSRSMEHAPLSLDLADMNTPPGTPERRRRRSNDPLQALHHQLAFARSEAGLDALVLVDRRAVWSQARAPGPRARCSPPTHPCSLTARSRAARRSSRGWRSSGAPWKCVPCRSTGARSFCAPEAAREPVARQASSMARAAAGCRRILGGEA